MFNRREALVGLLGFLALQLANPLTALAADTGGQVPKTPGTYAIFNTSMGTFTARLFEKEVPKTVANFTGLAEGTKEWMDPKTGKKVKKPFYNGLIFHRIIDGFMLQGGCPLGNGTGDPGYKFADEFNDKLRHTKGGILSMANSGPNTNGSQFFVTLAATPWLDGKHSVFGEVVNGIDVVNKIGKVETNGNSGGNRPLKDVVMKTVTIQRVK